MTQRTSIQNQNNMLVHFTVVLVYIYIPTLSFVAALASSTGISAVNNIVIEREIRWQLFEYSNILKFKFMYSFMYSCKYQVHLVLQLAQVHLVHQLAHFDQSMDALNCRHWPSQSVQQESEWWQFFSCWTGKENEVMEDIIHWSSSIRAQITYFYWPDQSLQIADPLQFFIK